MSPSGALHQLDLRPLPRALEQAPRGLDFLATRAQLPKEYREIQETRRDEEQRAACRQDRDKRFQIHVQFLAEKRNAVNRLVRRTETALPNENQTRKLFLSGSRISRMLSMGIKLEGVT